MLYKLLGMVVWKGGKRYLRQRYGRTYAPKPVIAGALVAVAVAGLVLLRRDGDGS